MVVTEVSCVRTSGVKKTPLGGVPASGLLRAKPHLVVELCATMSLSVFLVVCLCVFGNQF